ncbi:MAG TPA: sigma-54 dependent transcriptional regulator [Sandaracinaceae bacterium LLY-WYZ-13_1]|nr:sigma-54 dependent transcriptional regulator [Sandaracinaceae bacterium LLY-WYZ-13_1]
MATVLLVEDDPFESRMMEQYLSRGGHEVSHVATAEEAMEALTRELVDVVVTDLHLPGMSGLELLRRIAGEDAPPVIVVTGDTDVTMAVDAMRAGAADYVNKPLTMKALEHVLERVVETTRLRRRVSLLQREVQSDPDPSLTAASEAMRETLELARRSAASDSAVLLVGESGVGKEVVAAHLHRCSPRRGGPFVRINVAAIPDTMIEAELFGAVRGSFTGARQDRSGFFSAAHGGTLLLDEIAELRPELQAKLLRVIETHRYYPVGARREVHSDVRILAATNRDPEREVVTGRMRSDLYYRLASMVIRVPPLRERLEDIGPLARAMLTRVRRQTGRGPERIDDAAIRALEAHGWPGNVRELRNVIERAAILIDAPVLTPAGLESTGALSPRGGSSASAVASDEGDGDSASAEFRPRPLEAVVREATERTERAHIEATLRYAEGNKSRAAELLGVSRSTLWKKLRRYGD